jgi:DNA repair protein RadC
MQTDTITLRELTIRYTAKTDAAGEPILVGRRVSTPTDSAAVFTTMLEDEASEVFAILCLSTKHRVLAYHEVSRGCLDSTLVHPREVFKAALLANAATIVLHHYVSRHIMRLMCPESLCVGVSARAPMSAARRSKKDT